jgi:hypothetical protein
MHHQNTSLLVIGKRTGNCNQQWSLPPMKLTLAAVFSLIALGLVGVAAQAQEREQSFPEPSPYPITWELDFKHSRPKRIVVDVAGAIAPQAYWYITYTVTNNTDQEQIFLPVFEMLTNEGQVIRSDRSIPRRVFDAIRNRDRIQFLEPFTTIGGQLRLGEEQARDGVAIWEEPHPRMGRFSIFISGLSGETATVRDSQGEIVTNEDGRPILLRKTLQLNYHIRGDEVYPGEDEVTENEYEWVMR